MRKIPGPAVALLIGLSLTLGATRPGAAQSFRHPGAINTRESLDFIKAKVATGAQPWTAAYNELRAHSLASLSRVPQPRAVVECGAFS